jgi:hypothetical protein
MEIGNLPLILTGQLLLQNTGDEIMRCMLIQAERPSSRSQIVLTGIYAAASLQSWNTAAAAAADESSVVRAVTLLNQPLLNATFSACRRNRILRLLFWVQRSERAATMSELPVV